MFVYQLWSWKGEESVEMGVSVYVCLWVTEEVERYSAHILV